MQQRSLGSMHGVASILPVNCRWNRADRLRRWASILEQYEAAADLRPLIAAETLPVNELRALRFDSSPMALAFADLELHRHGLEGDTVGHAMDFFDLTVTEVDDVLCGCSYYGPMADDRGFTPKNVAGRLRELAESPGLWRHVRNALLRLRPAA